MSLNKVLNVSVWVLAVLVAALFLLSAIPKFFMEGWVGRFAGWGYPEWFLYVIAVLEAAGAAGVLIPRLAPYAAAGLIGIMIGAMYTHLSHDQAIWWNIGYVVCLTVVGWYRWSRPAAPAAASS
ncbi:MAG: DoxX family protein [Xanthomonadales bacterium]|nr:DoxX family protein [Xanthomonadales bacterium]